MPARAALSRVTVLPGSEAGRGHLAMLTFSALVAASFSLGSQAAPYVHPLALTTVRFALAAGIIAAIVLARGSLRREHLAAPWRYALWGSLMATYFAMMFWALQTATPVSTAAVFTLTPPMAALAGWGLMRQVTTPRMALALGLAACGAIWVIFGADWQAILAFQIGRGEVIFFFGCIAHALYIPLVPKLRRGEPGFVQTLGMLLGGTLVLALIGGGQVAQTDWAALPPIVWITLAYLATMASAVTFLLVQYAAMRLPAAKVMAYTYLVPSWVILLEGALGHGWPPLAVLAGVGLVITGLVLLLKD